MLTVLSLRRFTRPIRVLFSTFVFLSNPFRPLSPGPLSRSIDCFIATVPSCVLHNNNMSVSIILDIWYRFTSIDNLSCESVANYVFVSYCSFWSNLKSNFKSPLKHNHSNRTRMHSPVIQLRSSRTTRPTITLTVPWPLYRSPKNAMSTSYRHFSLSINLHWRAQLHLSTIATRTVRIRTRHCRRGTLVRLSINASDEALRKHFQ